MSITIALAGNPNSGKTTAFNALTGSNQYVGNWPGVTVEKKAGTYRKNKKIEIIDLPGVYSLSPYTMEEVVTRNYLVASKPDVLIDIVDANNIERNLYLATQLAELGIPMVLALNMMDVVRRNGDVINVPELEAALGCRIVEISALHKEGLDKLIEVAIEEAQRTHTKIEPTIRFGENLEDALAAITAAVGELKESPLARWYAVKLVEGDDAACETLVITEAERVQVNAIKAQLEKDFDDDGEGILTDARYTFVSDLAHRTVKKGREGLTLSDKIDRIVTNRWLAIPIFALVMWGIYYVSISIVGGAVTDWVNDDLIAGIIQGNVVEYLEGAEVAPWMVSLISDGVIGGVGAVVGFLPQIVTLFFFLAILENIGYMARIAFILDRVFRKFGLSGKSFIPILIGTGCAVPGVMATRTIENESDRRMTIVTASFMPCGAKYEILALFTASLFFGVWWFAPVAYFGGIAAVIITGIILKKTSFFAGDPAPFLMELPEYHMPMPSNILLTVWDRSKAFLIKAGTVIFLVVIVLWFLQNISIHGEFAEFAEDTDSILAFLGSIFAPLFIPLGFGAVDPDLAWIPTVASVAGIAAKEVVVGTMGLLAGYADFTSEDPNALTLAASLFTPTAALAFMLFNQLNVPCQAVVGAVKSEMGSWRWTIFTFMYQTIFAYVIAFIVYQLGSVLVGDLAFNSMTVVALVLLGIIVFLVVRKPSKKVNRYMHLSTEDSAVVKVGA